MIEDPPLLTVRRRFKRPSAEQLAAFAGLQTGFVVDAMGGRGGLDGRIKPMTAANVVSAASRCPAMPDRPTISPCSAR